MSKSTLRTVAAAIALVVTLAISVATAPSAGAASAISGARVSGAKYGGNLAVYVYDTAADGKCARSKITWDVPGPDPSGYSPWVCGAGTSGAWAYNWNVAGLRGAKLYACAGSSAGWSCSGTPYYVAR